MTVADMLAALGGKAKLEASASAQVTWSADTLYIRTPRELVHCSIDGANIDVRSGSTHHRCMLETLPLAVARIIFK